MSSSQTKEEPNDSQNPTLARQVGVGGAILLGLGSILGSGVFVSIGIAAQSAGPAVVGAIAIAAIVATCNGLSSAQLAANHPVSGGTYEYGYRWLQPSIGFAAGWMFLCAKSASAATAALGFAGYLLHVAGRDAPWEGVVLALVGLSALTVLVLTGLRRSNMVNASIVVLTILSLSAFVAAGVPVAWEAGGRHWNLEGTSPGAATFGLLEASALMFVAYTGYGRIATLGEEIREPRRNIPIAMIATLGVSMVIYLVVAATGVGAVGAESLRPDGGSLAAPLEIAARKMGAVTVSRVVAVGAVTAMLGVLLNLILGLSRVVLAMARRSDLPRRFSQLDAAGKTPTAAVILVSLIIAGLVLLGDVRLTWSFSAFTVLLYYAITNLAALRLNSEERLYPRWISAIGLTSCLFLAFWVKPLIWFAGFGVLAIGFLVRGTAQSMAKSKS